MAQARFERVDQCLEAAAAGLGIARVQRGQIDPYLELGQLVIAYPRCAGKDRGYFLCYAQALRGSSALLSFRSWVTAQGQAHERAALGT